MSLPNLKIQSTSTEIDVMKTSQVPLLVEECIAKPLSFILDYTVLHVWDGKQFAENVHVQYTVKRQ